MAFYDLTKEERQKKVAHIHHDLLKASEKNNKRAFVKFFSDDDTYIRKAAYQSTGKIYFAIRSIQEKLLHLLSELLLHKNAHVRQTVVNAAGEIGMKDFKKVKAFLEKGLFDENASVRNAVIGSIKKMGEKNPRPVLAWTKKYLHHADKEIRREICHGIELRGRTHPEDILPMLKELQFDKTRRVTNTLVHVLGQISYKKGCLEKVITDLKSWQNKEVVRLAVDEIIDVHDRYKDFAILTQQEAINYIKKNM